MKTLFATRTLFVLFTLSLGLLLQSGCGDVDDIGVVPVTGKVLFEGQPMPEALITFVPVESDGRSASGTTTNSGDFILMTPGAARSGSVPGSYRVAISKYISVDERGNPVDAPVLDSSLPASLQPQRPPTFSKSVLPLKYDDAGTSGLTAEVTRRGPNNFVFELVP